MESFGVPSSTVAPSHCRIKLELNNFVSFKPDDSNRLSVLQWNSLQSELELEVQSV